MQSKGLKYINNSETFIEYANGQDGIHKNIEEHNPNKKKNCIWLYDS